MHIIIITTYVRKKKTIRDDSPVSAEPLSVGEIISSYITIIYVRLLTNNPSLYCIVVAAWILANFVFFFLSAVVSFRIVFSPCGTNKNEDYRRINAALFVLILMQSSTDGETRAEERLLRPERPDEIARRRSGEK